MFPQGDHDSIYLYEQFFLSKLQETMNSSGGLLYSSRSFTEGFSKSTKSLKSRVVDLIKNLQL